MELIELGYSKDLTNYIEENNLESFEIGRVVSEHKDRYVVKTEVGEFESELIGKLRFTAESRYDLPAVGDWVSLMPYDKNKALIHVILPRKTILERKAVGKSSQIQIIATNIDKAFIVQSVDQNFNLNRIERYLTICHAAHIEPIIILSKIDLLSGKDLDDVVKKIKDRITNVPIVPIDNIKCDYSELLPLIHLGKTYCLLGSSGVGKSTLLNGLLGSDKMMTSAISDSVNKGRHTTTHRELIVLKDGGIIIDNPGMREVGITDNSEGLDVTFQEILALSNDCQFKDCTHVHEQGCSVLEAIEEGELDEGIYHNYLKMQKEQNFFETSLAERRKRDRSQGKLYKHIQNENRKRKY